MKGSIDRSKVLAKLVAALQKDISSKNTALTHTETARREAPGRMEARYDSRKEEMGRLAESQRKLILQTEKLITYLKDLEKTPTKAKSNAGTLLVLESGENRLAYLLVAMGGGISTKLSQETIMTLNIESPIGKTLLGRKVGDHLEIFNSQFEVTQVF